MDALLSLQPHGPHVLVGCGPFSCLLAAAIACELEHQGNQAGGGTVALVLADGAPALPTSIRLPPPETYGLFGLCVEAGVLGAPPAGRASGAAAGLGRVTWRAFAAEFAAVMRGIREEEEQLSQQQREGGVAAVPMAADAAALRAQHALRVMAQRYRLVGAGEGAKGEWEAQVDAVARACHLAARLCADYSSPEYVFQGR